MRLLLIFVSILVPLCHSHAEEVESVKPISDEIGFSLFTPGGINVVYSKATEDRTYKIAAGYLDPNSYGIEVGVTLIRNLDSIFRSVQMIAGTASVGTKIAGNKTLIEKWTYGGLSTTLQVGGFFVEPGITAGSGDFNSPQFSLQVGWLWKL